MGISVANMLIDLGETHLAAAASASDSDYCHFFQ